MSSILAGALSVALATNQLVAASNLVKQATGISVPVADPKDPGEKEYREIMELDDQVHDDIDRWLKENLDFSSQGAGMRKALLNSKIRVRLDAVRARYEKFLEQNPKHARGHTVYGSFLNDLGEEASAVVEWEKAREADPKLPAAWNNLANYYGHRGPVTKAFQYYEKALELNPGEGVYLQNLATTVFLFRQDAMEFYKLTEPQVFDKSLELYRKALELAPKDLALATDVAQTYYGIKPVRTADALKAWEYALQLAESSEEKEGIYIHMARVEITGGKIAEARQHLGMVTNQLYLDLRKRIERNLEKKLSGTNAVEAEAIPAK